MTAKHFTREYRYFVMKITDAKAALTQTEQEILDLLIDKVRRSRAHNGKAPLQGVFVENDWPEHDGVWAAIEQRMTAEPAPKQAAYPQPYPKPEPLVWPDLECAHDWFSGGAFAKDPKKRTCFYCKKTELIT